MLKTKTITHEGRGKTLQVTVSEASALMGMRRSVLISDALSYVAGKQEPPAAEEGNQGLDWLDDESNLALYLLRRYAWPDCIACTVKSKGFDHQSLTFEEFCQLPEAFIGQWQEAARELNPHWVEKPKEGEGEAAKKKKQEIQRKVNQALIEWLRKEQDKVPEADDDWTLNEPELSLPIWKAMEATDWRHLPYPGGLLDQPEWLIQDLYTLAWRKAMIRQSLKSPVQGKAVFGG